MRPYYKGRYSLFELDGNKQWQFIHTFISRKRALQIMEALFWQGYPVPSYRLYDRELKQHDVFHAAADYLHHQESYISPRFNNRPMDLTI